MNKLFNIIYVSILAAICISCANVDYMNRKSFRELRDSQGVASFIPTKYDGKKVKEYGGIIIKNVDEDAEEEGVANSESKKYIAFQRQKSRYFAQTLLYKAENEDKSAIDQTFFDFGYDKKRKGLSLMLTLKY